MTAISLFISGGCRFRDDRLFILLQATLPPSYVIDATRLADSLSSSDKERNDLAHGRLCAQPLVPYSVIPSVERYLASNSTEPLVFYFVGPLGTGKSTVASHLTRLSTNAYTLYPHNSDENNRSLVLDLLLDLSLTKDSALSDLLSLGSSNAANSNSTTSALADFCATTRHRIQACPQGVFVLEDAHMIEELSSPRSSMSLDPVNLTAGAGAAALPSIVKTLPLLYKSSGKRPLSQCRLKAPLYQKEFKLLV